MADDLVFRVCVVVVGSVPVVLVIVAMFVGLP